MYGVHYWGIVNSVYSDGHRSLAKRADRLDLYDFLHDNSPYKAHYMRPMNVLAPPKESVPTPTRHEAEDISSDTTEGSSSSSSGDETAEGGQEIDEYGSNRIKRARESHDSPAEEEDELLMVVDDDLRITPAPIEGSGCDNSREASVLDGPPPDDTIVSDAVDVNDDSGPSVPDGDARPDSTQPKSRQKATRLKAKAYKNASRERRSKFNAESQSRDDEVAMLRAQVAELQAKAAAKVDPRLEDNPDKDIASVDNPSQPESTRLMPCSSSHIPVYDPVLEDLLKSPVLDGTDDLCDPRGDDNSTKPSTDEVDAVNEPIIQYDNPPQDEELVDYEEEEAVDVNTMEVLQGQTKFSEEKNIESLREDTAEVHCSELCDPYNYV